MRAYLQSSCALFGVIALAHLLRLFRHWPVEFAGRAVPVWASWIGLLIAGALTLWAIRLLRAMPRTL